MGNLGAPTAEAGWRVMQRSEKSLPWGKCRGPSRPEQEQREHCGSSMPSKEGEPWEGEGLAGPWRPGSRVSILFQV